MYRTIIFRGLLKKQPGDLDGVTYTEITYEGYGPAGIADHGRCTTDNKNRSASEIRHAFSKNGGNLGESGSVSFMFNKQGILTINKSEAIDEDSLMLGCN